MVVYTSKALIPFFLVGEVLNHLSRLSVLVTMNINLTNVKVDDVEVFIRTSTYHMYCWGSDKNTTPCTPRAFPAGHISNFSKSTLIGLSHPKLRLNILRVCQRLKVLKRRW